VSKQLICQAQAWVTQGPILLSDANFQEWGSAQFNSPIELYFDIEAEPSIDVVYLHGVLLVDRRTGDQQFFPFLAENPEQEQQAWIEFLALVQAYPTAPIYHFCPYEVQTVKRLARLYDTPMTVIETLVPRFVDIHRWVTEMVTLPIENYTLKVIARWMGFEWRNSEANGAQSICWYEEWLNTGDRTLLDTIVTYNEDDCLATYRIKAWLDSYLDQRAMARLSA
jgi:predicted RecB family nuclease